MIEIASFYMSADLAALEDIESAAFADLYRAAPDAMRTSLSIDVARIGGATCLRCVRLHPAAIFRRACGLGVQTPARETAVDEIVRHMNGLGESYAVTVIPQAQPPALTGWLEAHGLARGYAFMKFCRSTAGAIDAPSDLAIAAIGPEQGAAFGRVISAGFGLPEAVTDWLARLPGRDGWVCLLATADGVPAAAAAAYVEGTHAWFGLGATLPQFRRRGGQNALLARRLREAQARGALTAVTETGERLPDRPSHSYRNIMRCGFREMYLRQNYMSPTQPSAGQGRAADAVIFSPRLDPTV
jgi:GNAT superfamily N-acetyltransferase